MNFNNKDIIIIRGIESPRLDVTEEELLIEANHKATFHYARIINNRTQYGLIQLIGASLWYQATSFVMNQTCVKLENQQQAVDSPNIVLNGLTGGKMTIIGGLEDEIVYALQSRCHLIPPPFAEGTAPRYLIVNESHYGLQETIRYLNTISAEPITVPTYAQISEQPIIQLNRVQLFGSCATVYITACEGYIATFSAPPTFNIEYPGILKVERAGTTRSRDRILKPASAVNGVFVLLDNDQPGAFNTLAMCDLTTSVPTRPSVYVCRPTSLGLAAIDDSIHRENFEQRRQMERQANADEIIRYAHIAYTKGISQTLAKVTQGRSKYSTPPGAIYTAHIVSEQETWSSIINDNRTLASERRGYILPEERTTLELRHLADQKFWTVQIRIGDEMFKRKNRIALTHADAADLQQRIQAQLANGEITEQRPPLPNTEMIINDAWYEHQRTPRLTFTTLNDLYTSDKIGYPRTASTGIKDHHIHHFQEHLTEAMDLSARHPEMAPFLEATAETWDGTHPPLVPYADKIALVADGELDAILTILRKRFIDAVDRAMNQTTITVDGEKFTNETSDNHFTDLTGAVVQVVPARKSTLATEFDIFEALGAIGYGAVKTRCKIDKTYVAKMEDGTLTRNQKGRDLEQILREADLWEQITDPAIQRTFLEAQALAEEGAITKELGIIFVHRKVASVCQAILRNPILARR